MPGRALNMHKDLDEKPPIGLKPRSIHNQERGLEISAAVHRYIAANKPVPREWLLELCDLYGTEA
jgi:hypothetical protein